MTMCTIRPMLIEDYESVIRLLSETDDVRLRDADSRDAVAKYLERNPSLSFVAEEGSLLVGCVMSGHDGRRGYLQHLAVLPEFRRRGVAKSLVSLCLIELGRLGIAKSHIDVLKANASGLRFWESQGWQLRGDIHRLSFVSSGGENV